MVISVDAIEQHANLFKALSDPTRLKLLRLLSENAAPRKPHDGHSEDEATECPPPHACEGQGFLCVNALAHRLGVTQSAVSQHLRVLRDANLVTADKRGYYVHYQINEKTLAAWKKLADELLDTEPE